ncbi:uncharacterized protein TRIADDRAFT_63562 [Trichoplax adhaerens]|uniref:Thioredoxin domain-containing protein n=1 Tax=Trichoplax adhaerens TaxID=10228 RepID=B3RIS1_TRIAD|nr:hypothetical protein TRIADDRAFT_63562 [Trichoplax adhaerens]EDV29030.1 hypothetical protein TRIADDRAFT_63562 [Trichoplax adhaerens]|eukprot:XP_002108232.1 hypothetical protein TRIADDRAFT_63562 [Trichoplax adhaerens]
MSSATFVFIAWLITQVNCHAIELDENFHSLRDDGNWLVMFYAPWCGHCQRLHPTWDDVSRELSETEIKVGKLDATKYSDLAQELGIKGFPTIKFFKDSNSSFDHYGGRTTDAIIGFARRAQGPSLRTLHSPGHYKDAKRKHKLEVFFLLVTDNSDNEDGKLVMEKYKNISDEKVLEGYFYTGNSRIIPDDIKTKIQNYPQLIVYKDSSQYLYEGDLESMWKWINEERFLFFPKVDEISFYETTTSGKLVVLLAIDEDYDNYKEHLKLSNIARLVAWEKREKYHNYIALPFLLVYNASDGIYYLPDQAPLSMTKESFASFLEKVIAKEDIVGYGGYSFIQKVHRVIWNIYSTVKDIWDAQPILALVFFLLPTLLICFVCYNMCTMEESDEGTDEFEDEERVEGEEDKLR